MFIKVLTGLAAIVAVLLVYAAFKSPHFEVSREITVNAPAAKVFPYVNNRTLANSWNPWLKMEPELKLTLTGPEEGVGSQTAWADGKQMGTGSATVTETIPNERVNVKLEYKKPFEMTQNAALLLKASGNQTVVTWKVEGEQNFICRLMSIFLNMDKMVGGAFEQGLAELKNLVEKTK